MLRLSFYFLLICVACCLVASPSTVQSAERIILVAGGDGPEDGPATDAKLIGPFGIDFDTQRNAYLVEIAGHRVLRIDTAGRLTRIGGTGKEGNGGDGKPALEAEFNGMHSLAVSRDRQIYIADTWNNRVRRIDLKTGTIHAFAGTGKKAYSGDGGPALTADFGGIYCVALDPAGERLILTDLDNRRIRVVEIESGIVNTAAGNGQKGKPADGAVATESPLVDPRAAVMDKDGNLYVLERGGHALRVVSADGKTRTLIGDGKGDTKMKGPKHLCIDRDNNVIIADTENHRILKYDLATQRTQVIAGSGKRGTAGVGGAPGSVELNQPHGVTIGPTGELFIVDSSNNRVLKIVRD